MVNVGNDGNVSDVLHTIPIYLCAKLAFFSEIFFGYRLFFLITFFFAECGWSYSIKIYKVFSESRYVIVANGFCCFLYIVLLRFQELCSSFESYASNYFNQCEVGELLDLTESMQIISLDTREILSQLDIGLWVLSMTKETGENRMIIDSKMRTLVGFRNEIAPQNCYETLLNGIHPDCIDSVQEMITNMMEVPKVHQVEFRWVHPKKGEIQARLTGKCVKKLENSVVFEGFLKVISDIF